MTLGISALLSMTVFLMTIRESLPPTEKTPLIGNACYHRYWLQIHISTHNIHIFNHFVLHISSLLRSEHLHRNLRLRPRSGHTEHPPSRVPRSSRAQSHQFPRTPSPRPNPSYTEGSAGSNPRIRRRRILPRHFRSPLPAQRESRPNTRYWVVCSM